MKRIVLVLGIVLGTFAAWTALQVFLPDWFANLLIGVLAVCGVYVAVKNRFGISSKASKWILGVSVGFLALTFVISPILHRKYPWVMNSLENRSLWTSFRISDGISPDRSNHLRSGLYQTRLADLENRELLLLEELQALQSKLSKSLPLSSTERKRLLEIQGELANFEAEREQIHLTSQGDSSRSSSFGLSPSQTFTGNKGDMLDTIWVDVDDLWVVESTHAFVAFSGTKGAVTYPSGRSSFRNRGLPGRLRVKPLSDGTTLAFRRSSVR